MTVSPSTGVVLLIVRVILVLLVVSHVVDSGAAHAVPVAAATVNPAAIATTLAPPITRRMLLLDMNFLSIVIWNNRPNRGI
ncbi:hypothetical protein [Rhodococcus spongiicola]|uniref:hypothetical protein n=1 Tax=Rhodococcus spongiicola TaxID=2487352 RepID=UPI001F31CC29|nr:hypothetical protein [Rhodococcus spongiicola]